MKYEFRNAAGQSCCKSDSIKHLCNACVEQALKQHERTAPQAIAAADAAPEPASLVDAIRASRNLPPINLDPVGQRPTVATASGVPDAPSLIDAIQQQRRARR